MAKPEPPKPIGWNVRKIASKAAWLGEVDASDQAATIEKAAAEYFWKGAQVERPAYVRHSQIETIVWYTSPGRGATPLKNPTASKPASDHLSAIISLNWAGNYCGHPVFVVGASARGMTGTGGHDMGEVVQYDQSTPSQ